MEYRKLEYSNTSPKRLEGRLVNYLKADYKEIDDSKDVAEMIFTDRTGSLKSTVKELLAEIERRENLHTNLNSRVGEDISKCGEYLQKVKFWTDRPYNPDTNFLRRKSNLEQQIFSLEEQKRTEDLTCWRDLMFLRKYLMVALKDYWKLTKCRNVLYGKNENSGRH